MHAFLRPNAAPVIARHLSRVNRAAFHACPNLPRQSHMHAPDGLRPTSVPAQENTNPSETFSDLDVLGSVPAPSSAVESTFADGFLLNNGMQVHDGVMLVDNEVFRWRPVERGGPEESKAKMGGVLELAEEAWGLLDVVYPKPGWFTSHPLPRYHYLIVLLYLTRLLMVHPRVGAVLVSFACTFLFGIYFIAVIYMTNRNIPLSLLQPKSNRSQPLTP